jgi:hypothetical protein
MPPSCTQAIYLIVAPSPNLVYITAFWRGVKFGIFYLKIIVTFDNENSKISIYLFTRTKFSLYQFLLLTDGTVDGQIKLGQN